MARTIRFLITSVVVIILYKSLYLLPSNYEWYTGTIDQPQWSGSSLPETSDSKVLSVLEAIANGEHVTHIDLSDCGLVRIPPEIFQVKDSLEMLNLGGNQLTYLPPEILTLHKLRVLFLSQNKFNTVPIILGGLPSLYMLSFKSNQIAHIDAASLAPSVGWLILTDNQIRELPPSIGSLTGLRKLMLAGNRLTALPDEMRNCRQLELIRLAANHLDISKLPDWLWRLPNLGWLAVGGNNNRRQAPAAAAVVDVAALPVVSWDDLNVGPVLGEGASGVVYRASWRQKQQQQQYQEQEQEQEPQLSRSEDTPVTTDEVDGATGGREVAVKLFRVAAVPEGGDAAAPAPAPAPASGAAGSDGFAQDEMAVTEAVGQHPALLGVLGRVEDAPYPTIESRRRTGMGLVLPLIPPEFSVLGSPPSFDTVTRDTFPPSSAAVRLTRAAGGEEQGVEGGRGEQGVEGAITGGGGGGVDNKASSKSMQPTPSSGAAVERLWWLWRVLRDVASACAHLHERGICHGDVYAHNILVDDEGRALLTDFGASSFYEPWGVGGGGGGTTTLDGGGIDGGGGGGARGAMELVEVRAFGCLVEDLLDLWGEAWVEGGAVVDKSRKIRRGGGVIQGIAPGGAILLAQLQRLREECLGVDVSSRPRFRDIVTMLDQLAL